MKVLLGTHTDATQSRINAEAMTLTIIVLAEIGGQNAGYDANNQLGIYIYH